MVVAGTADAREIVGELTKLGIKAFATVTSKFGRELLEETLGIEVHEGKLDAGGIASLLGSTHAKCLVDASHPYAREASVNAIAACEKTGIPYLRFERCETPLDCPEIIRVKTFEDAAEKLRDIKGNIFLTTGSNTLKIFINKIPDFKTRLFVRVLPDSKVLVKCEEAGLTAQNIVAVKGPFSVAMNIEMMKHCNAAVLVTKESGEAGGTAQKLQAAESLGIPVVLIERPDVSYGAKVGSVKEVLDFVKRTVVMKGGG